MLRDVWRAVKREGGRSCCPFGVIIRGGEGLRIYTYSGRIRARGIAGFVGNCMCEINENIDVRRYPIIYTSKGQSYSEKVSHHHLAQQVRHNMYTQPQL